MSKAEIKSRPGTIDELLAGKARLIIGRKNPWPYHYERRLGSILVFAADNADGILAKIHDYDLYKNLYKGVSKIIVYLPEKG